MYGTKRQLLLAQFLSFVAAGIALATEKKNTANNAISTQGGNICLHTAATIEEATAL